MREWGKTAGRRNGVGKGGRAMKIGRRASSIAKGLCSNTATLSSEYFDLRKGVVVEVVMGVYLSER